MPKTMTGLAVTLAFSLVAFTMPTSVWAAGPTLTVSADGGVHTFDRVADTPWPPIPGKDKSAGPFYIVWIGDQASSVPIMKWPYQVVSLPVQDAPAKRWPSLAVD